MRIILVTAYHDNLGHQSTRSVWFNRFRAFSTQPLSVRRQTGQLSCNAKGSSAPSHHDWSTRCWDVRRMRLMIRTNSHIRGGGGMILDAPDHPDESMRRENTLEGFEDVWSAGDPQICVLILDHGCIGIDIKLFFAVFCCVVFFFVVCLDADRQWDSCLEVLQATHSFCMWIVCKPIFLTYDVVFICLHLLPWHLQGSGEFLGARALCMCSWVRGLYRERFLCTRQCLFAVFVVSAFSHGVCRTQV